MSNQRCWLLLLLFWLIGFPLAAQQQFQSRRVSTVIICDNPVQLDTLSIVLNSVEVRDSMGRFVLPNFYSVNWTSATLTPSNIMPCGIYYVVYRVYPFSLSQPYYHRKESLSLSPDSIWHKRESLDYDNSFVDYIKGSDRLQKSGSISRGVVFGNNRDVSFTSGLNLQLSGELSDGVNIMAVVSDKNVPVQPEGNTQNFQEFDRIYIKVYGENADVTAGDVDIDGNSGEFFRVKRSARGAMLHIKSPKGSGAFYDITGGGAAAKGKYKRQQIVGVEGNQGPYLLQGADGDSYILIVSGSERIYLDGKELARGSDQDYTISYATAELYFTAKTPITKDSRITVEFEYSDQSYARFLTYLSGRWGGKSWGSFLNIYSESDLKNQPLGQNLTDYQKKILAIAGDDLNQAVVPGIDTVSYSNDLVLYQSVDTVVNGITYPVFVYSTNPVNARFELHFSYVGSGKGNYQVSPIIANGRVYQWVAPFNGIPQGNYEPQQKLIAPVKKQLATTGVTITQGRNMVVLETAGSVNDVNTFSTMNNADNLGAAISLKWDRMARRDTTHASDLTWRTSYRYLTSHFSPIDRFYPVEFERDWNLTSAVITSNEQFASGELAWQPFESGLIKVGTSYLSRESVFTGIKGNATIAVAKRWIQVELNGSYLLTADTSAKTHFARYGIKIEKAVSKLVVGVSGDVEENLWRSKQSDSLMAISKRFNEVEGYIRSGNKSKMPIKIAYKERHDYLASMNRMDLYSKAQELSTSLERTRTSGSFLKMLASYRSLRYADSLKTSEETVLGRVEGGTALLHRMVNLNGSYELGSGLIPKQDYTFVKVTPGQGQYAWVDYNGDGIKELNEFEVAAYSDQAEYVKVSLPTTNYLKAYTAAFSVVGTLVPARAWHDTTGVKSILACFSLTASAQSEEKQATFSAFPTFFPSLTNENLIAHKGYWRYGSGFNSLNRKYAVEAFIQSSSTKQLLVGGRENRNGLTKTLVLKYRPMASLLLGWQGEKGNSGLTSDVYPTKNNLIEGVKSSAKVEETMDLRFMLRLVWDYSEKKNSLGAERAFTHRLGLEGSASIPNKLKFEGSFSWVRINAFAPSISPVSYELLSGLKVGKNAVWSLTLSRKLPAGIEANISYNGRYLSDGKIIHAGTMEVRASF